MLQALAASSPQYTIVAEEGPDHQKKFVAQVEWNGRLLGQGTGLSKKQAETAAAEAALHSEEVKSLARDRIEQPSSLPGNNSVNEGVSNA